MTTDPRELRQNVANQSPNQAAAPMGRDPDRTIAGQIEALASQVDEAAATAAVIETRLASVLSLEDQKEDPQLAPPAHYVPPCELGNAIADAQTRIRHLHVRLNALSDRIVL